MPQFADMSCVSDLNSQRRITIGCTGAAVVDFFVCLQVFRRRPLNRTVTRLRNARMPTWTHPELGAFKHSYTGWAREMAFPAFKPFRYDWGGRLRTRNKITLEFQADDEDEDNIPLPSKRAIAVAQRTIKNQQLLADRIVKAMWNELNGRGRETGMWWHGDLRTINEQIVGVFDNRKGKPQCLAAPEDLHSLMGATLVHIRESTYLHERPSATICLSAAFDDEHGVGVLTDGTRVLGIGYQSDVTPYK